MKSAVEFLRARLSRMAPQARLTVEVAIFGLGAGLVAAGFHLGIDWIFRAGFEQLAHGASLGTFALGSLLIILLTSLVSGYLLSSYCPQAAGSGIPQLKQAFWKDFGEVPGRVIWVKFLAGVLTIGGGTSLGREGPSVQLGGGIASNLAAWLGIAKQKRRMAVAAGAAAGLAAAFNAPLAAITFVLEEILEDLNSRLLGSVILAAVVGAFVTHAIFGRQPAFRLPLLESIHWSTFLVVPLTAGVASAVGIAFQKAAIGLRGTLRQRPLLLPLWAMPCLGALITWCVGVVIFASTGHLGVFGLGFTDLDHAIAGQVSWGTALLLLGGKWLATSTSYGSGGCGGIFAPSLFFGAMSAVVLNAVYAWWLPLNADDRTLLVAVGLSACLGAVVRAPLTSILIVFELTHQFALVPALLLGALTSQAMSRLFLERSFYEAILHQDGEDLQRLLPPRDLRSWQSRPVASIGNFQPKVIRGLEPQAIREALDSASYRRFPVVIDGRLQGILMRPEAERAAREGAAPELKRAVVIPPTTSIREASARLIQSQYDFVVIGDESTGVVLGVMTLHDLLRAQLAVEQSRSDDGVS